MLNYTNVERVTYLQAPELLPGDICIAARGIAKQYLTVRGERIQGLVPVDLDVRTGSFTSIVGRSGCGKSTLLRMLAGLEKPTAGQISVFGEPLRGPPARVRYLFQNFGESLLPWKTVGENVKFGIDHRHNDRNQPQADTNAESLIDELLSEVGLKGVANRFPRELSGGMQQRVAIARALASAPDILLLDEPFSAVDALSRANLQDLILRVWEVHKLTILFVTHDIDEALYLADRIIVMRPGGQGILEDATIALPRPRNQVDTREQKNFLSLRRSVLASVLN